MYRDPDVIHGGELKFSPLTLVGGWPRISEPLLPLSIGEISFGSWGRKLKSHTIILYLKANKKLGMY